MAITTAPPRGGSELGRPGDLRATWLIARRGAIESLRDRTTLITSTVFALVLPFLMVLLVIRPQAGHGSKAQTALGSLMAAYLLVAGLLPSSGAISVASGLFAGEKEQGNLAPLLATPASNRAIFGGKILAAVLPSLVYSGVALASYLTEIVLLIGPSRLLLLPPALSLAMVALVPVYAVLGAAVASLISSRARTYQGAQMVSSLVLLPVMAALFGLAFTMQMWGVWALAIVVVLMTLVDVLLVVAGAATWRREEVLARR